MLFHAAAHPGTGVDIEQISIRFDEELDLDRMIAAWRQVTDRHRILRARFISTGDDEPRLDHLPAGGGADPDPVPFTVDDWSSLDPPGQEERIATCQRDDRLRDFDLTAGPPQRFTVARLGPDRWWLLWSFHHTILDGRSFPLVLREVMADYDSDPQPAPERLDFEHYVEAVTRQELGPARAYWTKRLEPVEAASSIPSEPTMSPGQAPAGPSVLPVERHLGQDRTDRLRALAAANDVSLNTCIQAAWYLLLGHHTQAPVVTFGTTRACRHAVAGSADMIGLLINTVPMVVAGDDDETVANLLRRLRQEQYELREHETTPLPVIRECAPPGVGELFETIVVFDDASLDARMAEAFPHHADTRHFRYDGQTNFPLTLLAYGDPSMLLRLEGAVDRYDQASLERLLDQVTNLLDGFVAAPDRPAHEVAYLTPAEHARYDAWNQTEVDYQLDTTLMALFEAQVARTPDAPALTRGDETLTYRQFDAEANRAAHHLRRLGVGPDTGVGIFAERSVEMMVAIYAVLKAGGAYVPLDPEHPADRIGFMAADSGVDLILAQATLAPSVPAGDHQVLTLEDRPWADEPATTPEPTLSPDQAAHSLAYLLYTSGSTGRPKGVMIEHQAIVNRLRWMQDAYQLDAGDVVLQKTPTTFDVSVWELFWPLQVGARLVMAEPGGHRDTAYLVEAINHHQVTTLHFVPSMLQLFVEDPAATTCGSVRRVICSGEALPRALQDRLFEVLDTELHNLYGPTEAAVDVTWWACDPASHLPTVPIGHPIANTQVHVLDRHLRRVPVGVQGELHIGGVQLARGYHNRPELTADRFVPDPFAPAELPAGWPGPARLYKTGDLVRHRPDGAVEFLGRLDHQVKIRGQRIELGEIEAVIADHPAVREVVVVAHGATAADTRLVAYVVTSEPLTNEELAEHCAHGLATYMVPTVWVTLDALPLNPNGKVDRKALPAPEFGDPSRELVVAGTGTEAAVAEVWAGVLGLDQVGVTDTFFDLGGNSLLLIRLSHLLSEQFTPVTVQQLLRHPTVRQQAELVTAARAGGDGGASGSGGSGDEAVAAGAELAAARRRRAGRRRRGTR